MSSAQSIYDEPKYFFMHIFKCKKDETYLFDMFVDQLCFLKGFLIDLKLI